MAEEIGFEVGKTGAVLVFGAEKYYDSLSTAACRETNGRDIKVAMQTSLRIIFLYGLVVAGIVGVCEHFGKDISLVWALVLVSAPLLLGMLFILLVNIHIALRRVVQCVRKKIKKKG